MKFNFKKVSAIIGSVLLTGMSVGMAAAASYPAPFVEGGMGDVAIVYGSSALPSDATAAESIKTNLETSVTGTTAVIDGESYPLFTSSSKIYMNDTLNVVRSTLTDTELPTVLADGDFEGDVSADYTQMIKLGANPSLVYGKHPTTDDEPTPAISLSTSTGTPAYNLTVTFDRAVNFTSSDSIGESLVLFGKEYTVGAGSTYQYLYLYETSETVSLSVGGSNPSSQMVTVDGSSYTVELVSATDTSADIKVTDSSGDSDTKTVNEDDSKKINGVDVSVDLADESDATNSISAQITVGANKVKLQDGSKVKVGSDEESIDGTIVQSTTTGGWNSTTSFTISIAAEDTSSDALIKGDSWTDPVFGTVGMVFSDLAGDDDREEISINPSSDKATLEFTTHDGKTKSIYWYYNDSATARLADSDDSGKDRFNVIEMAEVNITEYVMLGNEDEGYLLEFYELDNDSDSTNDDIVFRNAFDTSETYSVTGITTEGTGDLIVGGKTYTVTYYDKTAEGADYVRIAYPDSTEAEEAIVYPTIQTSNGAKLAFYEPLAISIGAYDGTDDLTGLQFPDGDGYTDVNVAYGGGNATQGNWTIGSATITTGTNYAHDVNVAYMKIGELWYSLNVTGTTVNSTTLYLLGTANDSITKPAVVLFEEKAQSSHTAADEIYHAVIVKMEGAGTSSAKLGVSDVETTWNSDGTNPDWDALQSEADDDIYYDFDLWGTLVTVDRSDSDSYSAVISYPDEQVNADVSFAEADAVSGTAGSLGDVVILDSEVSNYADSNLIVVGGSCVNTAAAALVGGSFCEADWTSNTGVGEGQFLIKSYATNDLTSEMALLVAGYEAADTTKAASYLTTQSVDTSESNVYSTSTSEVITA